MTDFFNLATDVSGSGSYQGNLASSYTNALHTQLETVGNWIGFLAKQADPTLTDAQVAAIVAQVTAGNFSLDGLFGAAQSKTEVLDADDITDPEPTLVLVGGEFDGLNIDLSAILGGSEIATWTTPAGKQTTTHYRELFTDLHEPDGFGEIAEPLDIAYVPTNGGSSVDPGYFTTNLDGDVTFDVVIKNADGLVVTDFSVDSDDGDLHLAGGPGLVGTYSFEVTASNGDEEVTETFNVVLGNNSANTIPDGDDFTLAADNNIVVARNDADSITGGAGTDYIQGGNDADTIHAGNGDDVIAGGAGADNLWGEGGNDTFVYFAAGDSSPGVNQQDTIHDFVHGEDSIDFSAIAGITEDAVEVFTAGTVAANGISWFDDGTNTHVYADTDGNAGAEMEIILTGTNLALTASDFIHA